MRREESRLDGEDGSNDCWGGTLMEKANTKWIKTFIQIVEEDNLLDLMDQHGLLKFTLSRTMNCRIIVELHSLLKKILLKANKIKMVILKLLEI